MSLTLEEMDAVLTHFEDAGAAPASGKVGMGAKGIPWGLKTSDPYDAPRTSKGRAWAKRTVSKQRRQAGKREITRQTQGEAAENYIPLEEMDQYLDEFLGALAAGAVRAAGAVGRGALKGAGAVGRSAGALAKKAAGAVGTKVAAAVIKHVAPHVVNAMAQHQEKPQPKTLAQHALSIAKRMQQNRIASVGGKSISDLRNKGRPNAY